LLRNLFRQKKEKEKEEGVEFREKVSEISEIVAKLSERQIEMQEKLSQLSGETSRLSEISETFKEMAIENSKRIAELEKELVTVKDQMKPKRKENRFIPIIEEMVLKEVKFVPESRELNFILAILKILPKKATIDSPPPFWDLVNSLWFELYLRKGGEYSRNDCRDALSALIDFTDVLDLHSREEYPHNLYFFHEKSDFFWKWAPLFR